MFKVIVLGLYFPRVAPAVASGAHCVFSADGTQSGRSLTSENAEISRLKEHKVRHLSSL